VRRLLLFAVLVPAVCGGLALNVGEASPGAQSAVTCGVERWAVKTLSDKRERLVDYTPHDSSVGRLRKSRIRTSARTRSGSTESRPRTTAWLPG
jgi:hypothetical protein